MLDAAFELWAAQGQVELSGKGWRTWLMMAGRGYGKTRAGAEWVHGLALSGKKRIALVGATMDEARAIMVEEVSGILAVAAAHGERVVWEPSLNQLRWPRTGSVATIYSGDKADGLRGPCMTLRGALSQIDLLLAGVVESGSVAAPPPAR